jgi:large subunit ribosomal protein L30
MQSYKMMSKRLMIVARPAQTLFHTTRLTPFIPVNRFYSTTASTATAATTTTTTATSIQQELSSTTATTTPRGRVLFITLKNSRFHKPKYLTEAFKVLGLKTLNQTVVHKDSPSIRGLVFRVRNFVQVESVSTSEFFPEGTQHIQIERKDRKEMRAEFIRKKNDARKDVEKHLEEAERVLAEYKQQKAAAEQNKQ